MLGACGKTEILEAICKYGLPYSPYGERYVVVEVCGDYEEENAVLDSFPREIAVECELPPVGNGDYGRRRVMVSLAGPFGDEKDVADALAYCKQRVKK